MKAWQEGVLGGAAAGIAVSGVAGLAFIREAQVVGSVAEWAAAIGTGGAFLVTYRLLKEEIAARHASDAADARRYQRDVARRLLAVLRPPHEAASSFGSGEAFTKEHCAHLARGIEAELFEVADDALRDRLSAVRLVAFTVGWGQEVFEQSMSSARPTSWGHATLRLRYLREQAVWSLEHYFNGDSLPAWTGLPRSVEAQSWISTAPPEDAQVPGIG